MQTPAHAGEIILKWSCKKFNAVNSLKALQLELIFCSARGTLTRKQEHRAKRKARTYLAVLHHYKKRYSLSLLNAKEISI